MERRDFTSLCQKVGSDAKSWHFHAVYGEYEATIAIATGDVNGELPKRAMAHVQEWRTLHREELLNTWTLARASKPLTRINPLE